jgi:hypothetical protein
MKQLSGIERIAKERRRQIRVEKWSSSHDDALIRRELAQAGALYALGAGHQTVLPWNWPWDAKWWKPGTDIRMLEKAGALIAAEIDRLLRLYRAPPRGR